jgi:uncharacterized protein YxeA
MNTNEFTLAIVVCVLVVILLSIVAIDNEKVMKTNCVINTSKQNLTVDEISKLCGVGK